MQVVRLSRKGRPRTVVEKAIEAVLAIRLTLSLSKEQVLGLYAAYAPFGGNTVGLDAAAWRYFGRDARQLSWAETADARRLPERAVARPPREEPRPSPREAEPPPGGAAGAGGDRRDDRRPREARATAARAGAGPHARPAPRRAAAARAGSAALPRRGREPLGAHDAPQARPGAGGGDRGPPPARPRRERRLERGRARPRRPDRRGARLRRQPVAPAGERRARRARGRGPRGTQHGQHPEAAALRVDAGGGGGAPGPARPRRPHPHRLVPPRELRPGVLGGGPRRPGARAVVERPRRPDAARARRRAVRRRAATPGGHDAHPPRRPLRPGPHPRRGGGHALGRDRGLCRRRPLGAGGDAGPRARGLLRADRHPEGPRSARSRGPRPSPPRRAT